MVEIWGDAIVLLSMLVSSHLPLLVLFPSNTWFIRLFTFFLPQILSILSAPVCYCMRSVQMRGEGGGVGSHGWCRDVLVLARKMTLEHDLMCQPEVQCRVPVRIPLLKGTLESSSSDHSWLQYRNRNCNLTVYPSPYVVCPFSLPWVN